MPLKKLPDRLLPLEEDLQHGSMHLRYGDWLLLKRGECTKVAARIRRRQTVRKWFMAPVFAAAMVGGIVRFVQRMQEPHTNWVWLQLGESVLWAGLLISQLAMRHRALGLAKRLEGLGDEG